MGVQSPKQIHGTLSEKFLIFSKKKCFKQPKKQNKLNFYFSLSGVPNVRGGWVRSDVWDKVPNKYVFFLTPSLRSPHHCGGHTASISSCPSCFHISQVKQALNKDTSTLLRILIKSNFFSTNKTLKCIYFEVNVSLSLNGVQ